MGFNGRNVCLWYMVGPNNEPIFIPRNDLCTPNNIVLIKWPITINFKDLIGNDFPSLLHTWFSLKKICGRSIVNQKCQYTIKENQRVLDVPPITFTFLPFHMTNMIIIPLLVISLFPIQHTESSHASCESSSPLSHYIFPFYLCSNNGTQLSLQTLTISLLPIFHPMTSLSHSRFSKVLIQTREGLLPNFFSRIER